MASDLANRRIEVELLDSLPADDPRAVGSRRDLTWINTLMFQAAIMARLLRAHMHKGQNRILEIGCGDGAFMLSVAQRLGKTWTDVDLVLLDQVDLITAKRRADFAALGWRIETVMSDVFAWVKRPDTGIFDVISANLFLHHFSNPDLQSLFAALHQRALVFIATEPRRNTVALGSTALLRAIGANDVTLHDAAASVRAGFKGAELSRLWPPGYTDQIDERGIGPFTHVFCVDNLPAGAAP
jgi:2-polyprenyl-3-methyl-5-hydroxy-6-metoxy-1,4-benzoquinol methylase